MKRRLSWLVLALGLAALGGGLAVLLQLRLAQGDVFPAYSSLRSDPLGTRALHDSLEQLPGVRVERGFDRLEEIPAAPPRTGRLAGWPAERWETVTREQVDALEAVVRRGGRVVFALQASGGAKATPAKKKTEAPASRPKPDEAEAKRMAREEKLQRVDLHRRWSVAAKTGPDFAFDETAVRTEEAGAAGLPQHVAWHSAAYFELEPDAGWQAIYRQGKRAVLVERPLGRGTIVLAADSYFLSNEALQQDRASALLAWIVGGSGRIVFDEAHLGVARNPGVAELARRYGLAGAGCTLLLLAALFVWRRMALFVPPVDEASEAALAYHPAAGLEALLRRSVAVTELAQACLAEWKATARPADRARVETAWAALPANAPLTARYNAAVRTLRRK